MSYLKSKENLNPNVANAGVQKSTRPSIYDSSRSLASKSQTSTAASTAKLGVRNPGSVTGTSRLGLGSTGVKRDTLANPRNLVNENSVSERLKMMENITSNLMAQMQTITSKLGTAECTFPTTLSTEKVEQSRTGSVQSTSQRASLASRAVSGRSAVVDPKPRTTVPVRNTASSVSTSRVGTTTSSRSIGTLSTVSERMKHMEDTILIFKKNIEQLTARHSQVDADLEAAKKDNTRLEEQVSTFTKLYTEAQERIKELVKAIEDTERRCKSEVESLNCKLLLSESNLEKSNLSLKIQRGEAERLNLTVSSQVEKIQELETGLLRNKIDLEKQQSLATQRGDRIVELNGEISQLKDQIAQLEMQASEDEQVRRKLHNSILELKGNIRVFCRVRPGNESDQVKYVFNKYDGTYMEIVQKQAKDVTGCNNAPDKHYVYRFDNVFPMDATQSVVFAEISQLVQSVLDGYNTCIFAYGQTGSGKTYTMEGPSVNLQSEESEGMITRAVRQIFETSRKMIERGWEYEASASFLEIYNEQIRDLLDAKNADTKKCEIKHDHEAGVTTVTNQTIVRVTSPLQVKDLLKIASKNRSVGSTLINERSSRSHCVFQLKLLGKNTVTGQCCEGVLNLVDLAGSERVSVSGVVGDRLTETKNINRSLSCLNDVISALANKEKHIPYRNSKLTWLLQNYLGGNSKTLMFVNISPDFENINETLNSLRFASRVNTCEIGTAKRGGKIDLNKD